MLPGGKGLNVSTVLKNLGMDSTALGFTAGFVGDEILRGLKILDLKVILLTWKMDVPALT